ncbi:RSP_2648 family PIN domain-containing protein [Yoonia sp. 208BN28-4]|uniref:RSP_2648 family PIN domain-containing protein n=1 Tax=Yoonia sp. 208BN28-4 TaxID=3126505 RepID=UPI0030AEAC93
MKVTIDACVLYPTVMREMVLGCADAGLFKPVWSDRILEEWARATRKLGAEAEVFARSEIVLLGTRYPTAIVPQNPTITARLWLPDPDDVHVLATAVASRSDVILTMNFKDFPSQILAEEGISRASPDMFLLGLLEANPDPVTAVAEAVLDEARRLSEHDWSMRALMKKARLPRLGKRLSVV